MHNNNMYMYMLRRMIRDWEGARKAAWPGSRSRPIH